MRHPKGIFKRDGFLHIRFQDEFGKIVRESTQQNSVKVAQQILAKRKTEVAMKVHFPMRKFEDVTFLELLDYRWENHGKHKPSKFDYLLPRLRKRFEGRKARDIGPEKVQDFLFGLRDKEGLSAASVNHYRTIMNSVYNFAIRWKQYDENPVRAVHQFTEPPGRDRFTDSDELRALLGVCDREGDPELKAFIVIAATTGLRKGSILPRRYSELHLDAIVPYVHVKRTKNGEPIKVPLSQLAVDAIRNLPSFGRDEYLFPAKPNVRFKGDFKKPHAWDIGKRFRRVCRLAGVKDLRIHDLRPYATTVLFMRGIPDPIISKMTGHKSRELKRYQHLSPVFKQQTVDLIAEELGKSPGKSTDTPTDTRPKKKRPPKNGGRNSLHQQEIVAEPTGLEPATSDVTVRKSSLKKFAKV
jgi:integrase